MFFKKAFFLGEVKLDRALQSLLQLSESCQLNSWPDWGVDILINEPHVAKVVRSHSRSLWNRYRELKKREGRNFLHSKFLILNNLPLDRITGEFPLVFRDYRRTLHSLKLAWAFYLTLKMKGLEMKFLQRVRGGRFVRKQGNVLTQLFLHIYSQLKKQGIRDESRIIKCLKNSLCRHVSESLEQDELPQGEYFNIVPEPFRPMIDRLNQEDRVNFFFSLLQSKALCQEVPESFVIAALEKHREQLSTPHVGVSEQALEDLRERGRSFGRIVAKYYRPGRGFNPTNKATCHFPRNRGGVKGDLVYHDILHSSEGIVQEKDRVEPFVVGLFGQPGMGKSSILPSLIASFRSLFPQTPWQELTYERSCNVEHWDGYKNQPIVILDDLGQSLEGKDIKEFQTLVSCNPYILPMADLPEKGRYFTSPIIIVTSNLQFGQKLNNVYEKTQGILDDASFWRRFAFPLYVENTKLYRLREKPNWVKASNLLIGQFRSPGSNLDPDFSPRYYQCRPSFGDQQADGSWGQSLWVPQETSSLGGTLRGLFKDRAKFHDNIRKTWTQTVNSRVDTLPESLSLEFFKEEVDVRLSYPAPIGGNWFDSQKGDESRFKDPKGPSELDQFLVFPAFPPEEPLPVRVEPIREPLKVRTITAGIGKTFCLKPLQRAMWLALGEEEQFCLTHGTNRLPDAIRRIYDQSAPGDVWLSGDYTAATDSFALEASKALMEGILESIDHMPTKRWAMKEISPHVLVYPKSSGLQPTLQKSGQLMGSLLSFPLLCLLNDCTAKSIGLNSNQYLINGDDILMRTQPKNYPLWKDRVRDYGLSLSLGKNYLHHRYGTVNSQLIRDGEVLCSGKQRVLDRRSQILGECLRDLEMMMSDRDSTELVDLFKSVNRQKLSRTVRSIHVPVSHGGLSLNWGRPLNSRDHRTALLVYTRDLFRKLQPKKGCISLPYFSVEKLKQVQLDEMSQAFNEPQDSSEYLEDFLTVKDLQQVKLRMRSQPSLRDLLGRRIEELPPLTFLNCLQIPVKGDVGDIQKGVDRQLFHAILHPQSDYTYELFRKNLEAVTSNREVSVVPKKNLFNIQDLSQDLVEKISLSYKDLSFNREEFINTFKGDFSPKKLDIPDFPDSEDFSRQIQDDFNFLLENLLNEESLESSEEGFNDPSCKDSTISSSSSIESPVKREPSWRKSRRMDFLPDPSHYWAYDTEKTEL